MADLFQYTYLEQYWLQTFILKCIALSVESRSPTTTDTQP